MCVKGQKKRQRAAPIQQRLSPLLRSTSSDLGGRRRRAAYFHHGASPVRKSVSVQALSSTLSASSTLACASASDRGAGPRIFLPVASYWLPWQGHLNLFSACVFWVCLCLGGERFLGGQWIAGEARWRRRRFLILRCSAAPTRPGVCAETTCIVICIIIIIMADGMPDARRLTLGAPRPWLQRKKTHRVPRHDAAQVRADGVDAVVLDLAVAGHDQVGGVALFFVSRCQKERGEGRGQRIAERSPRSAEMMMVRGARCCPSRPSVLWGSATAARRNAPGRSTSSKNPTPPGGQ